VAIKRDLVDHWMSLSRDELVETVRMSVKQHDSYAKRTWAIVRDNPLLAAKVRGALSALRAEVRGTRDEVMWLMWINEARGSLDSAEEPKAQRASVQVAPEPSEPDTSELHFDAPIVPHAASTAPSVLFQQPGL
jgi:hypothetical protein